MSIIKGAIQMTGSIKGMSFYTNPGSEKIIMRTKGGPSARRMKVGKEYEQVRKHQTEWSGCVKFSKGLRLALGQTYHLADYNVSPVWNGMGKNLIKLDTDHPVGERVLMISPYRKVLENFSLNRNFPFNSVLRISETSEVNRETMTGTVNIPQINTDMDLLNIQKLPYFRLIVSMGIVSDLLYNPEGRFSKYFPELNEYDGFSKSTLSGWLSANDMIVEQVMTIQFPGEVLEVITDRTTVLLGIGIEFGQVGFAGEIVPVKRAGCGKILKVC